MLDNDVFNAAKAAFERADALSLALGHRGPTQDFVVHLSKLIFGEDNLDIPKLRGLKSIIAPTD